jgi:signal peptidase
MRGDANPADDPQPYVVDSVRKVLVSVPGLAVVVVWFQNPVVLGMLTLGASALVTWMFWPRRPAGSPPRHRGRRRRAATTASGAAAVLALALVGAILPATPAHAGWLDSARASAAFTALTTKPVPTVSCPASGNGGIPISWTAPSGRAPTSYRVSWSGTAGSGNQIVTGTSFTIPGSLLALGGSSTVRVYARWGTWESAASLQARTYRVLSIIGLGGWSCS